MSTKSCSNDETLLFSILITFLKFGIRLFQMSFIYTGFQKLMCFLMMLR